jgi:pimeloyl-ACP methyl ester carboxylesterase
MRLEVVSHLPESPSHQTPLLFLHGEWHGAWCWEDYFLPYFAEKGFSTHAMSLRAHGMSEGRKRVRWVSIED